MSDALLTFRAEAAEARAEKAEAANREWKEDAANVLAERCAKDERHCVCVVHLRAALAAEKARADKASANCAAIRAHLDRAEATLHAVFEETRLLLGTDDEAAWETVQNAKSLAGDYLPAPRTDASAGWVSPEEHARVVLERDAVRDVARSLSATDGYPDDGSGPVAYMHKLRNMVAMLTNRAREVDRERDAALAVKAQLLVAADMARRGLEPAACGTDCGCEGTSPVCRAIDVLDAAIAAAKGGAT